MRHLTISALSGLLLSATSLHAQTTFSDLTSYCTAASESSSTTLLMRTQNLPRKQAEEMMSFMTDPKAIRMVKELIAFAYSRPASASVASLRAELLEQCLAKKIFVQ